MMMTRAATRAARSAVTSMVGPRYFSTTTLLRTNETAAFKLLDRVNGGSSHVRGVAAGFIRFPVRHMSTAALNDTTEEKVAAKEEKKPETGSAGDSGGADGKGLASYWGVQPKKIIKEDGTEWKWSCFMVCHFLYMFLGFPLFLLSILIILKYMIIDMNYYFGEAMGDILGRYVD